MDDLQLQRRLDALPRSIEPPEDLWPSVRGRIRRRATWQRPQLLRLAALLVLLAGASLWLAVVNHRASTWTYTFEGPRIGTLHPGDTLNSFGESAHLRVGTIGTMDMTPYSTLRIL